MKKCQRVSFGPKPHGAYFAYKENMLRAFTDKLLVYFPAYSENEMKKPINDLKEPGLILKAVDKFQQHLLEDSIKDHGLMTPLVVTQHNIIVDGYRRWLVCRGLGWTEIECSVVEGDADQLRVVCQTGTQEFTKTNKKQIVGRELDERPDSTAGEIAHKYKWSPVEVENLAGVCYLVPEAREWYNNGTLPLSTVWVLSRVKDKEQLDLMKNTPLEELHETAESHLREIKSARRRSFAQRARVKSYNKIEKELTDPRDAGPFLIKYECETPLDGWIAALRWCLEQK